MVSCHPVNALVLDLCQTDFAMRATRDRAAAVPLEDHMDLAGPQVDWARTMSRIMF